MDLLQAAMIARLFLRCRAAVCALFSVLGGKESLDRVCPGSVRCPDDSCPRGVRALAGSCPGYVRMPGWIPVQGVSDTWLAAVRGASGPGNSLSCMPAWRERKETGSGACAARVNLWMLDLVRMISRCMDTCLRNGGKEKGSRL